MQAPTQSIAGNAEPPGDVGTLSSVISSRPRGQVRLEKATCYFRGFKYTRAWASSRKISYRYSHWRQGCRGTMAFFIGTMGYTAGRPHTCRQVDAAGINLVDVTGLMKDRADMLAIDQVALPARRIWEDLRNEFYGANNEHVVRGLSETQVLRRVYQARSRHFSGDVHEAIEIPPLSLALNEAVSFFQFHYITMNRENLSKPTRLIGWAHPSLINLLRYNGTVD
ncbi:hypothetical protein ON010_g1664 [Phytophthora cinnamomi]|nr:hypothetical protein ON010_g1664 [Phytophthora cinnamomi]